MVLLLIKDRKLVVYLPAAPLRSFGEARVADRFRTSVNVRSAGTVTASGEASFGEARPAAGYVRSVGTRHCDRSEAELNRICRWGSILQPALRKAIVGRHC